MNAPYNQYQFEKEKNLKALGFTTLICVALLLVLFFVSWTLPQAPPPVLDEGVEVNLGNSDEGLGAIAPQMPGEPALAEENTYNPPKSASAADEPEQTKEVAENNDADAPAVNVSPKPV